MKEGEIINENEIVLPVPGSHVVAAGIGGKEKYMKKIFTIAYSEEEANEIGHFIMSKGYEGVQNDSYRYCDLAIKTAMKQNHAHHIDCIYIGVGSDCMIVAKTKRGLRRNGLKYIEKKRKFYELLSRY